MKSKAPAVNGTDWCLVKDAAETIMSGLKPDDVFHSTDYLSNVCSEIRKIMKQK